MYFLSALLLTVLVIAAATIFLWLAAQPQAAPVRPALEVVYRGETPEVDIIAVHGLGSNVDWTWTWQDGHRTVRWLQDADMLPSKLRHSRIITYNYVSRWHSNAPRTRLQLLGESLVTSLHEFREGVHDRPVIFIGHSLGGLVIAYALTCAARDKRFQYLVQQTVGFVSLGTPFRGTKAQSLADFVAKIMIFAGSHATVIRDLRLDNDILWDRLREFSQLQQSFNLPMYCFYELLDTDYGQKFGIPYLCRTMVVKNTSAAPEVWQSEGLNTDHLKLNKFAGPSDPSFERVFTQIQYMFNNWKEVIEQRKNKEEYVPALLIPFGRNEGFVGRDSILNKLRQMIRPSLKSQGCKRTVLEGLGGVGKTSIALEAVFRVKEEDPECNIFWVPAVDTNTFENAYREIGKRLKIPGIEDPQADIKALVKLGLSRLSKPWLLIIDNADDLDLVFENPGLHRYVPDSHIGSVLFTTRTHHISARLGILPANVICITELSRPEAHELLRRNLKEEQIQDQQSTIDLLDLLCDLPLAIKQATAYMYENDITATKYVKHYTSSDRNMIKLLSKDFYDLGRYQTSENPIATTWLISFRHMIENFPLAAKFLMNLSLLGEKDIPKALFIPVADEAPDELDITEAIGTLKAYAFVTQRIDLRSFDIHRLVRLTMRNWLHQAGKLSEQIGSVVRIFSKVFPDPYQSDKHIWVDFVPHGQELVRVAGTQIDDVAYLYLLDKLGISNLILGKSLDAAWLFKESMEKTIMLHGKEHLASLTRMNNLALAYRKQGRWTEAEDLLLQIIETRKKVLREEHPVTLDSMNELALTYQNQNRWVEAEDLGVYVLETRKKILGEEHPDTLATMGNLVLTYLDQRRWGEAEDLEVKVLEIRKKVLGEEHPETLTSISNLASTYKKQGRWSEAEDLEHQVLEISKKVLGEEHPDTLTSMNNLASTYKKQRRWTEAKDLQVQVVETKKKVLGEKHPSTLISMNNLASTYWDQGRYTEAENLEVTVLETRKKVLGEEHPYTLTSMNNLAHTWKSLGRTEEALSLLEECVKLKKMVLGLDHPDTQSAIDLLHEWETQKAEASSR